MSELDVEPSETHHSLHTTFDRGIRMAGTLRFLFENPDCQYKIKDSPAHVVLSDMIGSQIEAAVMLISRTVDSGKDGLLTRTVCTLEREYGSPLEKHLVDDEELLAKERERLARFSEDVIEFSGKPKLSFIRAYRTDRIAHELWMGQGSRDREKHFKHHGNYVQFTYWDLVRCLEDVCELIERARRLSGYPFADVDGLRNEAYEAARFFWNGLPCYKTMTGVA